MPDTSDEEKIRKAYSDLRDRLIAERDREQARIAMSQENLLRVENELIELQLEQRQLEGGR